tara:strand:- start:503 stop:802 length:300 start_codon:yes stop_codon:yes gene_type:complete
MPVIAINVSKKVYDHYHQLKKGTRSKNFVNILERHVRLFDDGQHPQSYKELETVIKQREDSIMRLQEIITELHNDVDNSNNEVEMLRSKSLFQRIFRWN